MYVASRTNVDTFDNSDTTLHQYTSVTMTSTSDQWFLIETDQEGASYTSDGSIENGSNMQEVTIELTIPKIEKTKAKQLQDLFESCEVVAILETFSGNAIVRGFDDLLGLDAAMRVAISDLIEGEVQGVNGYTVTMTGKTAETAREFTGSILLSDDTTKVF